MISNFPEINVPRVTKSDVQLDSADCVVLLPLNHFPSHKIIYTLSPQGGAHLAQSLLDREQMHDLLPYSNLLNWKFIKCRKRDYREGTARYCTRSGVTERN